MSEIHNYKTIFTSQVRDVDIEPLSLSGSEEEGDKERKKNKLFRTLYLLVLTL